MMQRNISIEEISTKLRPILGNKIDDLYFKYSLSDSPEEKNQILHILSVLYKKHLGKILDKKVLLEPPEKSLVQGEYEISKVVYANKELFPFCLREKDWPRHVCISGMSGSGKTTLALNILQRFIEKDKNFIVFDWKKSFRSLIHTDPSIMCFTVGNDMVSNLFKTNINRPPKGVSPKEWINTLCDLLTEGFCVSFGVHKILLETLDEVFEGWEVYKGSPHYPNWRHVKKMLEIKARESKGRELGWYESALRIASVLTFGDFGKVINYDGKKSLSVEDMFDKRIIFELNSLGNIEKKIFSEYLLTYIYKLKKANSGEIEEGFNHAILVDEAHNIFLKNKPYFVSESITDMIYREIREYGTCLICLDQHISKLSDTVKGNSACHIAFQQQLPQDVFDVSAIMQLWDKKEIFSQLPVGFAVVKLSERYTSPFLIQVPFIDLRSQSVDDEKIARRMDCIVQGIEVEKNDPEFKKALLGEQENPLDYQKQTIQKPEIMTEIPEISENTQELEDYQKQTIQKPEIMTEIPKNIQELETPQIEIKIQEQETTTEIPEQNFGLTKTQKVLYDFVLGQMNKSKTLREIEKILESGLCEKLYNSVDIMKTVNCAFEAQFKKKNQSEKKQEKSKEIKSINEPVVEYGFSEELDEEQKHFLNFLMKNPSHEYTTVQLYKTLGFSPRKGNTLKNQLLGKKMIEIQEQKNLKGWGKFINLSHKYSLLNKNHKPKTQEIQIH